MIDSIAISNFEDIYLDLKGFSTVTLSVSPIPISSGFSVDFFGSLKEFSIFDYKNFEFAGQET